MRALPGSAALQAMALFVGAYLVALALFSGFAKVLTAALITDPLVVRALAVTLLVGAGSIGWIGVRVVVGPWLVGPLLAAALPGAAGGWLLVYPDTLVQVTHSAFPGLLSWVFGLMGVLEMAFARWYGRSM